MKFDSSRLTFSEKEHQYTLDKGTPCEAVLASSTQMISGLSLTDTSFFRPEHLQAGTDRHYATELYDQGILDEDSLDENTGPAILAWQKFLNQSDFKVEEIEVRCFSENLLFAGTIDRVGLLDSKRTILDIKGSWNSPTYALQLWLYKIAWEEMTGDKIENLISVHLLKTGKYKVHAHHEISTAEAAARAVPVIFAWRNGSILWSSEVRSAMEDLCLFSQGELED